MLSHIPTSFIKRQGVCFNAVDWIRSKEGLGLEEMGHGVAHGAGHCVLLNNDQVEAYMEMHTMHTTSDHRLLQSIHMGYSHGLY